MTFIIAFPTASLIPQCAALAIARFLQSAIIQGRNVFDALLATAFTDRDFMFTTGLHLTWYTPARTCTQKAYGLATVSTPWGARLRCPNAACKGTFNDMHPRTYDQHTRVRFRCIACNMQTVDIISMPEWAIFVDKAALVVEYPLFIDKKPIADVLRDKHAMMPWTKKDKVSV